jgi:hypothetical protein
MTKFEYSTFVLGRYPTAASKYRKVNEDLAAESNKMFGKDKVLVSILKNIKTEFESMYEKDELSIDDDLQEKEYWIKKLAKQGAVELLSQGKVSSETMFKVSCLDNNSFEECIKETTKLSTHLNHVVQQAEKTVKPADIVPEELMR